MNPVFLAQAGHFLAPERHSLAPVGYLHGAGQYFPAGPAPGIGFSARAVAPVRGTKEATEKDVRFVSL